MNSVEKTGEHLNNVVRTSNLDGIKDFCKISLTLVHVVNKKYFQSEGVVLFRQKKKNLNGKNNSTNC